MHVPTNIAQTRLDDPNLPSHRAFKGIPVRHEPALRKVIINRARDNFNLGERLLDRVHPGAAGDDEGEEENAALERKKARKREIKWGSVDGRCRVGW
jgi:hypothetical protein